MSWDRDYFEKPSDFERKKTLTWIIMVATAGVFAVEFVWHYLIFRTSSTGLAIPRYFALHALDVVTKLWVWQLATHLFLQLDIFGLFFNLIALYFFGKMLEEMYGWRKFAVLYFGGGLLSALVFTAIGYLIFPGSVYSGPAGAIMAVLVMAALVNPNMTVIFFIFPMRLKYVVLLYIAADVYFTVSQLGIASLAHLAGAAWGLGVYKLYDRIAGALERMDEQAERKSRRREERAESEMEAEVDRILEKIAREGMGSLSAQEKKLLEQASRRKRVR